MSEYAVWGETMDGQTLMMRRGFTTRSRAEDHPVKMSLWSRVWVDEIEPKPKPVENPPPRPWSVEWTIWHGYVVDAEGRKIANLLGTHKRREHTAEILLSAVNAA